MLFLLKSTILALIIFCSLVFAGEEEERHEAKFKVSGSLRTVLEFEEDEISGHDLDFASYLRLNIQPLIDERISFYFYGRTRVDLDSDSVTDNVLNSSDDRIFQAYVELRDFPYPFIFRGGRQWIHEVEGVYLDGVRVAFPTWSDFDILVFGGRPVSAYSSTDGQSIFGGQIGYHPFKQTIFLVKGVRSNEDNSVVNDHIGFYVSQRFGNCARLYYDQKFLNRRSKDLRLGGTAHSEPLQLEVRGNYYKRINRFPRRRFDDVEARYFSYYFLLLGTMEEIERFSLTVTKYFGERLATSFGFSFTNIQGKESPTNRDTERYFVSLQLFNLFVEKMSLSVDANWVRADLTSTKKDVFTDVDGSGYEIFTKTKMDDETFSLTGELEYIFPKGFKAAIGITYGDYDFDRVLQSNQPISDMLSSSLQLADLGTRFITRTYFGEIDWRINRKWSAKMLVEHDHSKINTGENTDNYMRVVTSIKFRF